MQTSTNAVRVRSASRTDVETVFRIRANARRNTYKNFLSPKSWRSFEVQNAASPENLTRWQKKASEYLAQKDTYIFRVATINDVVVGWSLSDIREDQVHLMRLFVDPGYHGMGVGSKLLADLFRLVGNKRITLTVLKPNLQAISFYKKHDFKELGDARYTYLSVPCIKMEKRAPYIDKALV